MYIKGQRRQHAWKEGNDLAISFPPTWGKNEIRRRIRWPCRDCGGAPPGPPRLSLFPWRVCPAYFPTCTLLSVCQQVPITTTAWVKRHVEHRAACLWSRPVLAAALVCAELAGAFASSAASSVRISGPPPPTEEDRLLAPYWMQRRASETRHDPSRFQRVIAGHSDPAGREASWCSPCGRPASLASGLTAPPRMQGRRLRRLAKGLPGLHDGR